ncbi:hypothetical protein [Cohnella rhizoplanae]|uniref:hypothetical protein n=1 Tax=Cohnella rhizoplanae TaxID=2974897 RepID=UPI003D7C1B2C
MFSEAHTQKWVDWEIYASPRPHKDRTRMVFLEYSRLISDFPARLLDYINSGYAVTIN